MKKKPALKLLKVLLAIACFVAVERFCHHETRGFRDHKIYTTFPMDETLSSCPSEETYQNAQTILKQPFYFLGDGGQGYSFVSQDGKYVLKLFKLHHMRVTKLLQKIPLPPFLEKHKQKFIDYRAANKEKIFSSCKIAFDHFKEETALIYLHLNPTDNEFSKVTLYDAIGVKHEIVLDKAAFALQYKANLAFTHLKKDLIQRNEPEIEKSISSFVSFLSQRSEKGIEDLDFGLKRNYGFIDDRFIEIDIGSFKINTALKDKAIARKEIIKKTEGLRKIIESHYKEKIPYMDMAIEKALCERPFNEESPQVQEIGLPYP